MRGLHPGAHAKAPMLRAVILTMLALVRVSSAAQEPSALQIKVVVADAEKKPTPVPRHALLISDTPPSAAPRRVFTGPDGTVEIALPPGHYTVESDRPVALDGKAYQWTAMVEVSAGRRTSLALTIDNADVAAVVPEAAGPAAASDTDPNLLITRWQDSVVAVWTATTRALGVVIDARGLVATSQRALGDAESVAVQLTPAVKVSARVLLSDTARDVAILWVDASATAAIRPVVLECAPPNIAALVDGQEVFGISASLRGPKRLTSGTVMRAQRRIRVDWRMSPEAAGGPVFTAAGTLAGIASAPPDPTGARDDGEVLGVVEVCEALKSAEAKIGASESPSGARLAVEPSRSFPVSALGAAADLRTGVSIPYQMSSSEFDISFITPVLVHAAERRWQQSAGRDGLNTVRSPDALRERVRLLSDFGSWSDYFEEFPPVLLVRVTPKLVEGFWTKVARGAAQIQGVALPPMKRLTSGFARLRAFCGDDEVLPVHPFILAHRIAEREATHEGLYVFDPGALGPQCGTVRLTLYAQKDPDKADTRVVDPKILQQIWDDFAPWRSQPPLE